MPGPDSDLLAELARQMGDEQTLHMLWRRVVDAAIVQVDGAEHAGITLLSPVTVSTPVASDELVRQVDEHQYATGQGPCLSAAQDHDGTVVRTDDLTSDGRWPAFSSAVASLGVRSMLSFQLYTHTDTLGALNIYSTQVAAFGHDAERTGTLLATHAAVAAVAHNESAHLKVALQTRDVIGQAKGILMERYKITAEQAFDLLIVASQRTNKKLHQIADQLTATGEIGTT